MNATTTQITAAPSSATTTSAVTAVPVVPVTTSTQTSTLAQVRTTAQMGPNPGAIKRLVHVGEGRVTEEMRQRGSKF